MNFLPLIQIASITGIWAISFVVLLFAATVASLLSGAGKSSRRALLALGVGIFLCGIIIFGKWRLSVKPPGDSTMVTLIGKDVAMSTYLGPEEHALKLLAEYANEVARVTPAGNDVVVLPEKVARIREDSLPQIDALFSAAARATNSAIDLGLVRLTADGGYNSARFYARDGKVLANYDKHHLLPGIEPERPGRLRVTLDQPSGRWGLQICKDMDFPQLSREYAGDRANLLLVPAWDFEVDRWLHARMAVLRAIESGFGLARSARNGLLTLADNRGRIIAEKPTMPDQFVSLTGKVLVAAERTFYARTGDWFAWICAATVVLLLGYRFFPGRRREVLSTSQ
jgi:apolipoprotein N-acyltransferase